MYSVVTNEAGAEPSRPRCPWFLLDSPPPGLGSGPSIRPLPGLPPPPRAARRPIAVSIPAGRWGGRRPGRASSLLTAHGKPGGGPFESVKRLDPTLRSSYRSPRPLQSRARGGPWHDTGRIPQSQQWPLGLGCCLIGQCGPSGPVEALTAPSLATGGMLPHGPERPVGSSGGAYCSLRGHWGGCCRMGQSGLSGPVEGPIAPSVATGRGCCLMGQSGLSGPVEGPTAPSLATGRGCYLQSPPTTRLR